jgi:hypothetical protein
MNPCRFAPTCPHEGTVLVRIHGVGDRRVCLEHVAWMTQTGMDFRRLDVEAFVPRWRQSDLRRDETGRHAA